MLQQHLKKETEFPQRDNVSWPVKTTEGVFNTEVCRPTLERRTHTPTTLMSTQAATKNAGGDITTFRSQRKATPLPRCELHTRLL